MHSEFEIVLGLEKYYFLANWGVTLLNVLFQPQLFKIRNLFGKIIIINKIQRTHLIKMYSHLSLTLSKVFIQKVLSFRVFWRAHLFVCGCMGHLCVFAHMGKVDNMLCVCVCVYRRQTHTEFIYVVYKIAIISAQPAGSSWLISKKAKQGQVWLILGREAIGNTNAVG